MQGGLVRNVLKHEYLVLHFGGTVSAEEVQAELTRMGEQGWRITIPPVAAVVGNVPGLTYTMERRLD